MLAEHLNTLRLVANAQGQTVWRWDQQEPFGVNAPDENPSGAGVFEFPMRFAGQYFDRETNLAYNYFRDFDSGIGRYVQSDPIGLYGGINLYLYVSGSPLLAIDPTGEADHKKGARESTREKHEQGQAAKEQSRGGEKGDKERAPPRKRPPNHKGPWPTKAPRICTPLFIYEWLLEMCYADPSSGACYILPPDSDDPCSQPGCPA